MTESRRNELERTRRTLRSNIYAYDANGKAQKAGRVLSHLCERLAPPPPFPVPAGPDAEKISAALAVTRQRLADEEERQRRACFSVRRRAASTPASMAREIERVRKLRDRIGKLTRMAAGRDAFDAKYINPFAGGPK